MDGITVVRRGLADRYSLNDFLFARFQYLLQYELITDTVPCFKKTQCCGIITKCRKNKCLVEISGGHTGGAVHQGPHALGGSTAAPDKNLSWKSKPNGH